MKIIRDKVVFFIIILILCIPACQKNPPEITNTFWQLNFTYDLTTSREAADLSLFLGVTDEDGQEDIETIFLFNDKEELYWEINSGNWYKSESWIGINNIRMADYSPPPAGEYRIVVQDIGGETDEEIILIGFTKNKKDYPVVKIEKGILSIKGSRDNYAIRVYNNNNKFITNYIYNKNREIDLKQEILVRNNIQQNGYFDVYYFDPEQDTGFTIGPYFF